MRGRRRAVFACFYSFKYPMEFVLPPSSDAPSGRLDAARWPASKIEMWPVADLSPYVKNARTHPQEQVDQIAAVDGAVRLYDPDACR